MQKQLLSPSNLIAIFFLLAIIFHGCYDCGDTYSVPQECKNYGYFLKGSYWVYQNDSTSEVDSFITKFDTTEWQSAPVFSEPCDQLEPVPYNTYESLYSIAYSDETGDSLEYTCSSGGVDFFIDGRFKGIYFTPAARENNDLSDWKIINSLNADGKIYTNVYESTYVKGSNIYFVENVGVIKMEFSNDSTTAIESWSLVRFKIIQ